MPIINLSNFEELPEFSRLTDVRLRRSFEPAQGMYIAESFNVISRALKAGHAPISFLTPPQWVEELMKLLESLEVDHQRYPIYVAPMEILEQLTGFRLHRSAMAAIQRPILPSVPTTLEGANRVAIFDDFVDHTNVGAAFRSAAGLGVDAVLVTPTCADPFYRRAIRVSMGAVFHLPWTIIDPWPQGITLLKEHGFSTAAFALNNDAITLDSFHPPEKLALVFGNEGHGLPPTTLNYVDTVVRIPMHHSIDSLNVAAATAVAFWATR